MIVPCPDERLSPLETMTRQGIGRRRPRFGIENQSPRCPICNQIMIALMNSRGPAWHCGCNANGNGKNGKH